MAGIPEEILAKLEHDRQHGVTSGEILELFESHRIKFSEATLRKYVQLGLLPRSVRVGRKGKHQGSQGLYPAGIVRQIVAIKAMMAQNLTIEEIQREVLFVRGDIEELSKRLDKIFTTLKQAAKNGQSERLPRTVTAEVGVAEQLARDLVGKLVSLENRLTFEAQVTRRAAS